MTAAVTSTATGQRPRIGSLCSGYGGLDLAIEQFFDAETAWFSEFDPAPSKVLAAHWPGVPNLGDMTAIDWASAPKVEIIGGGTPCQDLSAAGRRKGMTEGTRSNLWVQMREAIAVIRPSIVVWENVRGAFSAYATSEVESESGLLGVYGLDRPALRALGRVLGDLSDLGYDAEWVGVRASDAGAPHSRSRVFVLAYAASARWTAVNDRAGESAARRSGLWESAGNHRLSPAQDADLTTGSEWGQSAPGQTQRGRTRADIGGRGGASTADTDSSGCVEHGGAITVQPEHETPEYRSADTAPDACGERFGEHTGESSAEETRTHSGHELADHHGVRPATEWGPYRPAIERWERILGRFAPAPTERSAKGSQRLSPRFVEWMMGLPEGHVTSPVIGLTRNQQLKALGNGVVPQQAELALSILWARMSLAVTA